MKKLSVKKYSILGLVILIVSAVTAAIIPAKKNSLHPRCNGVLALEESDEPFNPDWTCEYVIGTIKNCFSVEFLDTHAGQGFNTTAAGTTQDCDEVF
jgi:hypothetical protein